MLKILFENKNVIVCAKPHGVLSQRGAGGNGKDEDDMLSAVSSYIGREAGLLHRLDRPTGGIMVFSKNKNIEGRLSAAISDKSICTKEYLAVVSGKSEENCGEMRDLLFKDAAAGKSFVVSSPRKGAKEAVLYYETLGTFEGEQGELSLVRIRLGTGRTHQIRVQFSSRKTPLYGDGKYGSKTNEKCTALWSYRLTFPHPVTKKQMCFTSLPDQDFPWTAFGWKNDRFSSLV